MSSPPSKRSIITIEYNDLVPCHKPDDTENTTEVLRNKIGAAFGNGSTCLGILAITNIPSFSELRRSLLPLARDVSLLPNLNDLTIPSAGFSVGWSHGKERVQGENKFDTAKGSFYANPLTDDFVESVKIRCEQRRREEEYENVKKAAEEHPSFFAPNIWPKETLPRLEPTFQEMGLLICQIGRILAKHCDAYVALQCPGYNPTKLQSLLTNSMYCKGRLLHYFSNINDDSPNNKDDDDDMDEESEFSNWCGWHNDHGSLTGLVPAMYLDQHGHEVNCPDESAGLYIKSRNGDLVHICLPPDSLAFQVGETTQIHTGGILQATPHAVRGPKSSLLTHDNNNNNIITRESFAVFMEPEYHDAMDLPHGKTVHDVQSLDAETLLPTSVKTLRSRWNEGMNFGEFSDATFKAFY